MKLHSVKIIETADLSTRALFKLSLSLEFCRINKSWPSLFTLNDFLQRGEDDGEKGTDIKWEPCQLTQEEYEYTLNSISDPGGYTIDKREMGWGRWFNELSGKRLI